MLILSPHSILTNLIIWHYFATIKCDEHCHCMQTVNGVAGDLKAATEKHINCQKYVNSDLSIEI